MTQIPYTPGTCGVHSVYMKSGLSTWVQEPCPGARAWPFDLAPKLALTNEGPVFHVERRGGVTPEKRRRDPHQGAFRFKFEHLPRNIILRGLARHFLYLYLAALVSGAGRGREGI